VSSSACCCEYVIMMSPAATNPTLSSLLHRRMLRNSLWQCEHAACDLCATCGSSRRVALSAAADATLGHHHCPLTTLYSVAIAARVHTSTQLISCYLSASCPGLGRTALLCGCLHTGLVGLNKHYPKPK
jgi:hypothetical protein